jgi:hypothetical protein
VDLVQGNEAYGGVEVWSDYNATDRSWHVVVRRDGRISEERSQCVVALSAPFAFKPTRSRTLLFVP